MKLLLNEVKGSIMEINRKVAVVTGAASGLGLASARALHAAGARVVAVDLNDEALAQAVGTMGADVRALAIDVSDEVAIGRGVSGVLEQEGAVHILVNCAGVLGPAKTVSRDTLFPLELWNQVIAVNLSGTFHMIRHCARAMTHNAPDASGDRGVIINTASGAAWQGQKGQAAYSATKAGVIGLTLPVARDLAQHAIRIVAIAPGLFETGMSAGMPQKVFDNLVDTTLLYPPRMGVPPEYAALVRHIVENAYLNATTISLDGGARVGNR